MIRALMFAAALLLTGNAWADQAEVFGVWSGGDSLVEVTSDGENLSMKVLAIREAVYLPNETAGEPGSPRRDDNNPDPALKEQLIVGMELLSEYRWTGKRWEGKIYDPGTGKTYSSRMERDGDQLKMRGYIGAPMFGRNQFFEPVERCDASVAEMVAVSEVSVEFCD